MGTRELSSVVVAGGPVENGLRGGEALMVGELQPDVASGTSRLGEILRSDRGHVS